ncbi:MAG: uridine diphosphate-N-acetylglucosamine-binding protein YvcK [Candidatus Magasanikbacteria bacterium]|nr:uridine diphosphate-N-acetylglucosamine-binding protein YvcK [Candidatus Magasanikbacteria bacterium]
MKDKKKVVIIGGGNGSAIALEALKKHRDIFDISAVISVSDSGGSSGRLRQEFNTLPPGDILRAVLSLSLYDYSVLRKFFYSNRFSGDGKLSDHNLGNLFLTLTGKYAGDFMSAVRALEESVEAVGHVYPATLEQTDLCAELENGQIIKTEAAIDKPNYDRSLKIKKAWLEPAGRIYFEAREALVGADYIIFSPGSVYTSVIAAILPAGVKEAIAQSEAKLIFSMGSAYIKDGETGPTTVSDAIRTLEKYLPRKLDLTLLSDTKLSDIQKAVNEKRGWEVFMDDEENQAGMNIVRADYRKEDGCLCSDKLGKILREVIGDKNN